MASSCDNFLGQALETGPLYSGYEIQRRAPPLPGSHFVNDDRRDKLRVEPLIGPGARRATPADGSPCHRSPPTSPPLSARSAVPVIFALPARRSCSRRGWTSRVSDPSPCPFCQSRPNNSSPRRTRAIRTRRGHTDRHEGAANLADTL